MQTKKQPLEGPFSALLSSKFINAANAKANGQKYHQTSLVQESELPLLAACFKRLVDGSAENVMDTSFEPRGDSVRLYAKWVHDGAVCEGNLEVGVLRLDLLVGLLSSWHGTIAALDSGKVDRDYMAQIMALPKPDPKKRQRELTICIDTRECEYLAEITEIMKTMHPTRRIESLVRRETLPLFDIVFRLPNGDMFGQGIESKSWQDLSASVIDGRLKNQKKRMIDTGMPREKCMFVIHGDLTEGRGITPMARLGTVNSVKRDGCHAAIIDSKRTAALYICAQHTFFEQATPDKVQERGLDFAQSMDNVGNKQEFEENPGNKMQMLLERVRLMSAPRARAIMEVYPTFSDLMRAYMDCPMGAPWHMLADIPSGDGTIGKALSEHVYDFFEIGKLLDIDESARKERKAPKKRPAAGESSRKRVQNDETEDECEDNEPRQKNAPPPRTEYAEDKMFDAFKKARQSAWMDD